MVHHHHSCPRQSLWRSPAPFGTVLLGFVVLLLMAPALSGQSLSASNDQIDLLLHPGDDRATLLVTQKAADDGSPLAARRRTTLGLELGPGGYVTSLGTTEAGWIVAGELITADRRRALLLKSGASGEVQDLPAPTSDARIQTNPHLLIEGQKLQGLAWLEGSSSRRLAPVMALWNGESWEPPQTIAPTGRASQTGLRATVLADGTSIFVWSAYDGEDDEILVRTFDGETWGETLTLSSNQVPDITPTVTATPEGALLAWSRYDGSNYRLVVVRFEQGRKVAETMLGAPGSLQPHLSSAGADGSHLLYLDGTNKTWSLLELAPEGRIVRRASTPASSRDRPAIVFGSDRIVFSPADADEATTSWSRTSEPLTWALPE